MDYQLVGKRIAKARKAKGLSASGAAALAGIHRDTVRNIETGAHAALITTIEKLAKAVGLKL